jgi:hypothetical protein
MVTATGLATKRSRKQLETAIISEASAVLTRGGGFVTFRRNPLRLVTRPA